MSDAPRPASRATAALMGVGGGTPTDRWRSASNFDHVGSFGVDTIRFRGPVPADAFRGATTQHFTSRVIRGTGEVPVPRPTVGTFDTDSNAWVEVRRIADRPHAVVELSVPRWRRGDNNRPATPEEVVATVREAYTELAPLVDWQCDVDDVEVARLDIARDFHGVVDAPVLLEQFSHLKAAGKGEVRRDKDCAGAQTVYKRTGRWVVRAYDRGRMYADHASRTRTGERDRLLALSAQEEGKVRYELQLRPRLLKDAKLNRTAALETTTLAAWSRRYFDKVRLGEPVGDAKAGIRQKALAAQARGDDEYKDFGIGLTVAVFDSLNLPLPLKARSTARRHRAVAASQGLSAADLLGVGPMRRLDFMTGTVVLDPDAMWSGDRAA